MTAKDYLGKFVKVVNNHIIIGPMPEDSPFCQTCWESKGEVVEAPFNPQQNGWVCPKGHFGPNGGGGRTQSATVYGPR